MYIERPYKKLLWFEFLDHMKAELRDLPPKEKYIELLDEMRMRKIESLSEGGSYKIKAPAKELVAMFEMRMAQDKDFASDKELEECMQLLKDIL